MESDFSRLVALWEVCGKFRRKKKTPEAHAPAGRFFRRASVAGSASCGRKARGQVIKAKLSEALRCGTHHFTGVHGYL